MRIRQIRLEGFRGFREPAEIPFGLGFTIICGRNGAGKSTVCDAMEFALTGTIERFSEAAERGEYISDYIWWRGKNPAQAQSVSITFMDDQGNEFTVVRDRRGLRNGSIADLLCERGAAPREWPSKLCLTSIIRDETITKLSVDKAERDRYEFVLEGIGLAASSAVVEEKTAEVLEILEKHVATAASAYERHRATVESWASELSEARISAAKSTDADVDRLRKLYAQETKGAQADLTELAKLIAMRISQHRDRLDSLVRLQKEKEGLDRRVASVEWDEYERNLKIQETRLKVLQENVSDAKRRRDGLREKLQDYEAQSPFLTSLAVLRENGARIGLRDGRCPLCGSKIAAEAFREHLRATGEEIERSSEAVSILARDENEATVEFERIRQQYEKVEVEHLDLSHMREDLQQQANQLLEVAGRLA